MSILDEIVTYKKMLLETGYYEAKLKTLPHVDVHHKSTLVERLEQSRHVEVIAEIKSQSPTVRDIPERPLEHQIQAYCEGGAAAISILTDEQFFNGTFERLADLTQQTDLPVLCKDFMIDERQIDVAKRAGASIILLIVHILSDAQLKRLYRYAQQLNLEVLVEVHNERELERAQRLCPKIIGVNNRDLQHFVTKVEHTNKILKNKSNDIYYISESGIKTSTDVEKIVPSGIHGVLVGETLMKAEYPATLLQTFKRKRVGSRCI
ncbi:indole-3-glycerol phosphate synthase TrpC [Staphylococcus ratti]|uniref:Indole-3-glycerol phosphate synthase n=1 Tax=Staphylococcus ratti TaxID=2892440 RepID=A0ABY3PDL1_9STAP|nr:indole-3-glycerol phosphate synthase TrpC [Staphylococcus ratti]UEX90412.1 indole-3-glycerol phosphate synthase TrpC [Staphylococcus ratti]